MGGWSNDNRDRIFWDGWLSQKNDPVIKSDLINKNFWDLNLSGTTNYITKFTGNNSVGNSQIYDTGSFIGFGTTSETAGTFYSPFRFYSSETDVATRNYKSGVQIDYTITPSSYNSIAQRYGLQVNANILGSQNWANFWGQRFDVTSLHSGGNSGNTIANIGGQWVRVSLSGNDNAVTTNVYGAYLEVQQTDTRAPITNAYSLFIKGIAIAGTHQTGTSITNRYAIYQDGQYDPNYFKGVIYGANDVIFVTSGSGLCYGSMYGDDINVTITISASSTYYELGSGLTGGSCNNFTFQNSKELKCLVAGNYKVDWAMSLECASAGQYVEGAVMINSTAQSNTIGAAELITANKKVCVGGTGIITLAVNDVVKLCVENETGTNNIICDHATLALVQVGA